MKTIQEQIAVMQHFANGGEVESNSDNHGMWFPNSKPSWNWYGVDYRIKPAEKKKVRVFAHISRATGNVWFFEDVRGSEFGWYRAPWLDGEVEVEE